MQDIPWYLPHQTALLPRLPDCHQTAHISLLVCPVGSPTLISNLPLMMSLIMLAGDPSIEPSGNKAPAIAF